MSCVRKNFRSRFSWPTRIHSNRSTCRARAGSVSPVNAAATIFLTPAFRAELASNLGYTPLPAMIPRISGVFTPVKLTTACRREKINAKCGSAATVGTLRSLPHLSVVAAAFDVQLGQRFLQRGLNSRHLFGSMVFFHRRFRALDRGLGCSDVDLLGFERHVGQNRNRVGFDLYKTLADGHCGFASTFDD